MSSSVEKKKGIDREGLESRIKSLYRELTLRPEGAFPFKTGRHLAERLGYPASILDGVPAEALNSFAGVGYFFHLAEIRSGERVVDLGCGAGVDTFIAAGHTGVDGKVLGLDITGEPLEKARSLQERYSFAQVLFHQAGIERLPIAGDSTDMVISNGAINMAIDKGAVFREVARVLRPGGRLVLADIVCSQKLPAKITRNAELWAAGIGGAIPPDQYVSLLENAGLKMVIIEDNPQFTFVSGKGRELSLECGLKSISLLAIRK